jgi:hypothetical protein
MPHPRPDRSITYLNLHLSLKQFADILGWTFSAVYFYKIGFSLPAVFAIWAGFFFIRLLIRPWYLRLLSGRNLKKFIILATLLYGLVYILLALVHRLPLWLIAFLPYYAAVDTLYWLTYHTYFTVAGSNDRRGRDVFLRQALTDIGAVLSPLAGGLAINLFGFNSIWLAGVVFVLVSALPLLLARGAVIHRNIPFRQAFRSVDRVACGFI